MKKISFATQLIIFSLPLIILLAACSRNTGSVAKVHVGTEGLAIRFIPGGPPDKVYADTNFQIGIELQNKGAHDIEGGQYLVSLEDEFTRLDGTPRQQFRIRGRSQYSPVGETIYRTLNAQASSLPDESQNRQTTVRVTTCYPYTTKATADICIDTDPLGIRRQRKPCTTYPISMSGGQGGPVAITSIVPEMISAEHGTITPLFTIKLANRGQGQVFQPDKISDACSARQIGFDNINTVHLTANIGDQSLTCTPNRVKLTQESTVRCKLEDGIGTDAGTYTSQITITIKYGYTQTINKDITIQRQ